MSPRKTVFPLKNLPTSARVRASLAKNIRRLRLKAKFSQQELAERADMTLSTIQRIEYQTYHTRLATLAKVRKALGATWEEICEGI